MFPPEVFTEIFSILASEPRVLVACSQAHSIFAQLVEPTLYAHVIIHDNHADLADEHHLKLKPYQLSTLLSDKPRILNYLRSLCVELGVYSDDEATKEIISILPGLKLERIQLTLSHHISDWQFFPITFRTAFVACISTSRMKEICLDNIHRIPLISFADCAGLKRLVLWSDAVPPPNNSFNFPHLETLELSDWTMARHSQDFSSWLSRHACGLRSLTLTTAKKNVVHGFLPHLLAIFSTSLVNLNIYYTIPLCYDAAAVEIDFPGLPSLERLRLCAYTGMLKNFDKNFIRYALGAISQILQQFSLLRHLTLVVCLQSRGGDLTQIDWSPLADFLSDRRSSFQHTDLYIRVEKAGSEVSSDEVISTLSRYKNLMDLVEAGYASIKEEKFLDMHVDRFFKYA